MVFLLYFRCNRFLFLFGRISLVNFTIVEPRRLNIRDGYFGKCFPSDDLTILERAIKLINDESEIWCLSNGKSSDGSNRICRVAGRRR